MLELYVVGCDLVWLKSVQHLNRACVRRACVCVSCNRELMAVC